MARRPPATNKLLVVWVLVATVLVSGPSAGAQGGDPPPVVITEIHYHPQAVGSAYPDYDDREDTEFIEIVNLAQGPVDLTGWCLTEAIDFCFPAGSTLAAQDPFVVAYDAAAFDDLYDSEPDGVYTSRLANDGELVQLVDDAGTVVAAVDWDTTDPWPVTPDGNGPSLELIAAAGANGDPANWAASAVTGGTPGVLASLAGASPPLVVEHTAPRPAVAGVPIQVTATATDATSVTVTYDIDFGSNIDVEMTESNGRWQAQLPALGRGDMMRFRFSATGPGGTTTSPRADDSLDWWVTAVPTQPESQVPTFDLHVKSADWAGIEGLTCGCEAVVVHDGRMWGDVIVRRAGYTSINLAKGNYRLDFPDGHPFEASWLDGPSDELALDAGYPNFDLMREALSWQMMERIGFPAIQNHHVRVSRNGNFHGLYLLREEQDGDWRADHGFDNGAFYKVDAPGASFGFRGRFDKKEALDEPDTDIGSLRTCLSNSGSQLRSCLIDQTDVAQIVHEIAAMTLIQQTDQREFNYFVWRDDTENGLWRMLPDDLDRTWGVWPVINPIASTDQPYRRCIGTDGVPANEICRAFMSLPEFEQMVNRRIRTMTDEVLADPAWPTEIAAMANRISVDWNDDENRWNRIGANFATITNDLQGWVGRYVTHIRNGGHNDKIPGAQSAAPTVVVTETRPDAGDGIAWALLANPSGTESVDVSGWEFEGLATIDPGAVILPGQTIAVTNDDAALRQAKPNFAGVRAWLDGTIVGQARLLRRDGSVAAVVGEPPPNLLILNEWNAVSSTNVLPGGDPNLGSDPGNGGDWFELVVVEDHLDVRGWRLVIIDSDGDSVAVRDEFVFADRPELADLESGLIITVSEDRPDDLYYSPIDDDWHINLAANSADEGEFFTADSQSNFDTNHHDWQLAIFDADGDLVFGPAGEGVGALSGLNASEVGELDTDPSFDVDPEADYSDGNASTYGRPNETAGIAQDFSALRYDYVEGDVDCDGTSDIGDALFIAQLTVGNREPVERCPLGASDQLNVLTGDLNVSGRTDIADALIIAQCSVGIDQGFCPP